MLPLATAAAAAADAADARDEAGDRFHRSRPWQHAVNIWSLVMTPVQFSSPLGNGVGGSPCGWVRSIIKSLPGCLILINYGIINTKCQKNVVANLQVFKIQLSVLLFYVAILL